jgi:hypothetical protein
VFSGKEKEVLAMENGGNDKVNAIFEARLPSPSTKPSNHADGPTRERFIRDKYERRKYYDPAGFAIYAASAANRPPPESEQLQRKQVGPPSDTARQRLEQRRARINKAQSTVSSDSGGSRNAGRGVAKAPVSAPPPTMDLLDFGPTPTPQPPAQAEKQPASQMDLFNFLVVDNNPGEQKTQEPPAWQQQQQQKPAQAAPAPSSFGADIMSLYSGGQAQHPQMQAGPFSAMQQPQDPFASMNGGGTTSNGMANMGNLSAGMQGMSFNPNMQQMSPQQMMNRQPMNQQQMMMMMQQQQQQQQMMMMQKQRQQMMMQQQRGGMMMNGGGGGMQQQQPQGMMMNPGGMQQGGFGGGGGAMGNGPPVSTIQIGGPPSTKPNKQQRSEKEDPFAQFGVNVFRS